MLVVFLLQGEGPMDVQIKVCSAENPELSKMPSLKPEVGQNISLYADLLTGILPL